MVIRDGLILACIWAAAGCGGTRRDSDGGAMCASRQVFRIEGNRKIDLLFVIDDSPAMASMEAKLAVQLPRLMSVLMDPSSNMSPDLHVAVVSSSLGGGRFTNVPGCEARGPGDQGGRFSHPADAGLHPGDTFMRFNGRPINLEDDPGTVFSHLAALGHAGCPYPQPLEAARRALTKAQDPTDPDNAGFLRSDADLGVIIITNEDDCSVPANSDLFDPTQTAPADPYGAPGPYRCAEHGWLCGGTAPPHQLPAGLEQLALDACVPAAGDGKLTPLSEFSAFLKGLKASPDDVMLSVVTGPEQPVVIVPSPANMNDPVMPTAPALQPSCTGTSGETATPGVRLTQLVIDFQGGILMPACGSDLRPVLSNVAFNLNIKLTDCLLGVPVSTTDGDAPNCRVTETHVDENGVETRWDLPSCDPDRTVIPCWRLDPTHREHCLQGEPFRVCRDASCFSSQAASGRSDVVVQCQASCP